MAASRAAARERVLREFESAQTSLGSKTTAGKASITGPATGGAEKNGQGTKRKFDLDEDEIDRLAKEATDEALNRTALELAESRKAKLPNFWLVSGRRSPSAPRTDFGDSLSHLSHRVRHPRTSSTSSCKLFVRSPSPHTPSGEFLCFLAVSSSPKADLFVLPSLKSLTVVKFEQDGDKTTSGDVSCICPCCRKSLTNNVKAYGEKRGRCPSNPN